MVDSTIACSIYWVSTYSVPVHFGLVDNTASLTSRRRQFPAQSVDESSISTVYLLIGALALLYDAFFLGVLMGFLVARRLSLSCHYSLTDGWVSRRTWKDPFGPSCMKAVLWHQEALWVLCSFTASSSEDLMPFSLASSIQKSFGVHQLYGMVEILIHSWYTSQS